MPDTIFLYAENVNKIKKYVDVNGKYYYRIDLREDIEVDGKQKNRATVIRFLRNIEECIQEIFVEAILVDIIEKCKLRLLLLEQRDGSSR